MLHGEGKEMPKHIKFQFDNCGENKVTLHNLSIYLTVSTDLRNICVVPQNKNLFSYLSLLVEMGHFRTIEVYFLIVGHTHSSIDQYFSVLSTAIKSAQFIGSPLALHELFRRACSGNSEAVSPYIVRSIDVYYDWVTLLKPYINSSIKVCLSIFFSNFF